MGSGTKAGCQPFNGTELPGSGKPSREADLESSSLFGGSHTAAYLLAPLLAGDARGRDIDPALVKLAIAAVASPWGVKRKNK